VGQRSVGVFGSRHDGSIALDRNVLGREAQRCDQCRDRRTLIHLSRISVDHDLDRFGRFGHVVGRIQIFFVTSDVRRV